MPSLLLNHGLDKFLDAAATGLSGEITPARPSEGHPDRTLAPHSRSQVSSTIFVHIKYQVGPPSLCFDSVVYFV